MHRRISIKNPFINTAFKAIAKTEFIIMRDFGEMAHLSLGKEQGAAFVKNTEKRIAEKIALALQEAYPNFGCFVEGNNWIYGNSSNYWWLIDPIDGTKNFTHNIPHFAITISLIFNNEVILGLTFDPMKDELFYSVKDNGAFLDNRKLKTASSRPLSKSLIVHNNLHLLLKKQMKNQGKDIEENYIENIMKQEKGFLKNNPGPIENEALVYALTQRNCYIKDEQIDAWHDKGASKRITGSASLDLAYLAAGRIDFFQGNILRPWDISNGLLMVKEANGFAVHWECSRRFTDTTEAHRLPIIKAPDSWCVVLAHNNSTLEFVNITDKIK